MKCQSQFSGKNKKTVISLLSAELVQRVVEANIPVLIFLSKNNL